MASAGDVRIALFCIVATTTVTLGFLAHVALADPKPIDLQVRPRIAFEPQDLFLSIRITHPTDRDRLLRLSVSDGSFQYDVSDIPLIGAASPKLVTRTWRGLPAGEYVIYVKLGDDFNHWRAFDSRPVQILAR